MRLVLDTKVVASAVLWGGVPRLLLQAGREWRVELFTAAWRCGHCSLPDYPTGSKLHEATGQLGWQF